VSTDLQEKLARRFRGQADACRDLGSPLYGVLAERAAENVAAGGPVWRVMEPLAGAPGGALVSLRFLGSTHRLALSGQAPGLAAQYPSCGGSGDPDQAWAALLALTEDAPPALAPLLHNGVQTNEVGRASALLGGFLSVARETGLPLRMLEVGTSAGLNMRWDHFTYAGWGPPGSPVDQGDPWIGEVRPLFEPATVGIAERAGCDVRPLDPTTEDGRLTLLSFVWPDMTRRFAMLAGACSIAAGVPVSIDEAPADGWVRARLAAPVDGVATVVFHSVVLQYLDAEARSRLLATIRQAGEAATAAAPVAWLRLEPPPGGLAGDFEVRLATWPGGEDRLLAAAHPHGTWVRWAA
jgi:hypothetical protein